MRAVAWTTWFSLSALVGCASSAAPQLVAARAPEGARELLLGRAGWDAAAPDAAQAFALRSDWPSTPLGYFLDDSSVAFDSSYSDQSFFDKLGGGYYGQSGSVRTRVLRR